MAYQAIPPTGGTDAWYSAAVASMKGLAPALTRFEYLKAGQQPNAAATVAPMSIDATGEGGAMGVASDTLYSKYSTAVWQTPRTVPSAVVFRCKFPVITSGLVSLVAMATSGNVRILGFGWVEASSATKWMLLPSGGSSVISTVNADTNWHTVVMAVNVAGSVITATVDGVTVATSAAVATLTNSACQPAAFTSNALAPGVLIERIAYGYVDPT